MNRLQVGTDAALRLATRCRVYQGLAPLAIDYRRVAAESVLACMRHEFTTAERRATIGPNGAKVNSQGC
jgi:hypothetical protein